MAPHEVHEDEDGFSIELRNRPRRQGAGTSGYDSDNGRDDPEAYLSPAERERYLRERSGEQS